MAAMPSAVRWSASVSHCGSADGLAVFAQIALGEGAGRMAQAVRQDGSIGLDVCHVTLHHPSVPRKGDFWSGGCQQGWDVPLSTNVIFRQA